jgi:hypothetical protein
MPFMPSIGLHHIARPHQQHMHLATPFARPVLAWPFPALALLLLPCTPSGKPTQVSSARLKSVWSIETWQGKARQGKARQKAMRVPPRHDHPSYCPLPMARLDHTAAQQGGGGRAHQLCPVQQSASGEHGLAHTIRHVVVHKGTGARDQLR